MSHQQQISDLKEKIAVALDDSQKQDFLYRAMKRGRDSRAETLQWLEGGTAFRDKVKATKDRCRGCHEDLLDQFVESAKKRGVHVYIAKTGQDAIEYCLKLGERCCTCEV